MSLVVDNGSTWLHALLLSTRKLLWEVLATVHDLHLFQDSSTRFFAL
jgi:hypothetical protein